MGKYGNESDRQKLARTLASEAIVLLKNDEDILPLNKNSKVAVFGRTQNEVIIGGGGSGASVSNSVLPIMEELKKAGLIPDKNLEDFYLNRFNEENEADIQPDFDLEKLAGLVASGLIYEIFGKYNPAKEEYLPDEDLFKIASKDTDTALLFIGRSTGGEECDRRIQDDYYLSDSEKALVERVTGYFSNVIVIFNVNGLLDMSWMDNYPEIKAAVLMGTLGEQGAGALADILAGVTTPSGRLTQTIALKYEDYPTSEHFSFNKDANNNIKTYKDYGLSAAENGSIGFELSPVTVYQEDIYVGYRYFTSFNKPVLYPFGYGLSYAKFTQECKSFECKDGKALIKVRVKNVSSNYSGKEVVELYISTPSGKTNKAALELKAFEKTKLLKPDEEETLMLQFDLSDMAYFDENERAYILEEGIYRLYLGTDCLNTEHIADIIASKDITTKKVKCNIGLRQENAGKIDFLKAKETVHTDEEPSYRIEISESDIKMHLREIKSYDFSVESKPSVLSDVASNKVSMEEFINQMSLKELAVLCCGYGPGVPFGGLGQSLPATIKDDEGNDIATNSHKSAMPGYINPAINKYGIESKYYKDGPASVGKTAWPTGMMLSCSFNKELLYEFGNACGHEAEELDVTSWLAPGMNIIRNPIEGRAFEYFSEDPYVCGVCGTMIAKGAMENNNITVCPKHFALNEQETYRRGSIKKSIDAVDTIVSERAAREIYLKPFEMVVTLAKPLTIMTSFNKINGTFAAGSYELNTKILREEWGYEGVVVTDWGDMDIVVDGADAVAAGNDVIMPGGPPVIAQILKGYDEGRVTIDELRVAVSHLMNMLLL